MTTNRIVLIGAVSAALVAVAAWMTWPRHHGGLPAGGDTGSVASAPLAVGMPGEALFNQKCAVCHGRQAAGSGVGPPLVHRYYEPGHHSDMAFVLAVKRGVRAHHWRYGNMPPVPGLSDAQVKEIIRYVRALQRARGIF